ncbi:MAG: hypothetical protein LPK92_06515, partial [Actinomycetes bacterium]|nr:hypothetical protein [Actinomycetes bacterium]MDX5399357.1 hypothetical protein [Actinomycetes bacterium]MDX5450228.1 hypothetical protein [Actinomycetes bacterium]
VLRTLVATSLLRVEVGDVSYYRMPETVRLFARDQLRLAGTWTDVLRRHDAALGASCRELRDDLFGRDASSARAAVVAEITDHEAAFDRALADRRPVDALAMAWALGNSWLFSGALAAGVERLERVLAATAKTRTAERADALAVGAFLLVYVQRYADAAAWSGEAVEIHRTTGDDRGLAYALARRGHAGLLSGDSAGAIAALRESLETCERIGDDDGRAWPVTLLAQARLWGGDGGDEVRTMFAEGRRRFLGMGDTYGQIHATTFLANLLPPADRGRYFREALTLAELPGTDPLIRPLALHNFAFYVWNQGDRERAREVNRLLGRSALELGATVYSAMAFLQGAHFAGVVGEPERAAVLRGAGDRHFTTRLAPFWAEQLQPGVDAAARALGEGVYESLHSRGRGMSVREATAFLLDRGRTVPGQAIG